MLRAFMADNSDESTWAATAETDKTRRLEARVAILI
jgi:hypothetical protein